MNNHFAGVNAGSSITTGSNNTGVGDGALENLTTGGQTVAVGFEAGNSLEGATNGMAVGYRSLFLISEGNNNHAVGYRSMFYAKDGAYNNTALGYGTLHGGHYTTPTTNSFTGNQNTAVGMEAMYYCQTGEGNTAVGMYALNGADTRNSGTTNSPSWNVSIGHSALKALDIGQYNTAIGYDAGSDLVNGSRNILIGQRVQSSGPNANLELNIGDVIKGDLASGFVGIIADGSMPTAALHVKNATATIRMQDADGSGNSAKAFVDGYDMNGARLFFVGKAASNAHLYVTNDLQGGSVLLQPGDGGEVVAYKPVRLMAHNASNPPSASDGAIAYFSNGKNGAPCLAIKLGGQWQVVSTQGLISP